MPVSPQSAIEQLRERFPHYRELPDEQVYRIARRKYPNAPIQDWPEAGYVSPKKISPEDMYLEKTDEDSFLDYFNIYNIDEDSSYLARLAYSRSLQGMASDFIRGNPKFTLERQPQLWEEAVAGIMSYAMPLDLLSLYGGGSVLGKAFIGSTLGKGATDYITKGILKVAPKAKYNQISRAVAGVLGSEMAYVPYEAAKSNMFARTIHMQNPGMEPLTPEEIQKETFAGVVHGGLMGVLGGSVRPFLAAKHAKHLREIDKLSLKKSLTSGQEKELFSLKNKVKYTGGLGQYASEVVGLTAGDVAGTAVAYGQMKSMQELGLSLVTMGGFTGITRLTSYGLNKAVNEPLEEAYKSYKIEYEKRQKELDAEQSIMRDMHTKAKSQGDSAAETIAMNKATDDATPEAQTPRVPFEQTKEHKEYLELLADKESFIRNRDKFTDEKALEFLSEKYKIALRIAEFVKNSGYKKSQDSVNGIHEWLSDGAAQIQKSIKQKQGDIPSQIGNIQLRLKEEFDISTIKVSDDKQNLIDIDISKAQQYMPGDTPVEKQTNLLSKLEELYSEAEKTQTKKRDRKYEQKEQEVLGLGRSKDEINKSIEKLQKKSDADPTNDEISIELYNEKRASEFIDEIDSEINVINQDKKLSANEKDKKILNLELLKTFMSRQYKAMGANVEGKELRAKQLIELIKTVNKETNLKFTELNSATIQDFVKKVMKKDASAATDYLNFLDTKGALPLELRGLGDQIFSIAKGAKKEKLKKGLTPDDVKGGGGLDIITSKTGTRKNINWSTIKSRFSRLTTKSLLKKVISLVKKPGNKVKTDKGVEYQSLFFAKKLVDGEFVNETISSETLTQISKQLFGDKISGKTFRKAFATWVDNKYGRASTQFELVDYFGLTHRNIKDLIYQSYQAKFGKDKDGMPTGQYLQMFKDLQDEYQNLIFDNVSSANMLKLKEKQLKKYGLTPGNLELTGTASIYNLKQGFENIALLSQTADSKGFITFKGAGPRSNTYKIHKDVLEAMFRTMSEGSSRITEQFAAAATKKVIGLPLSGKFPPLQELLQKAGVIEYSKQIESSQPLIEFTPSQKDIFRKTSLQKNSTDDVKSLRAKAKILLAGNLNTEVTRKNLGNKKYETKLKEILVDSKLLTKEEAAKMKKISLRDDVVDEAVLTKLLKYIDCSK